MTQDDEAARIEAKLDEMAEAAANWTDEQFATKIVELLILDKGLVNAWQRTIETMIKISRKRDAIIAAKRG